MPQPDDGRDDLAAVAVALHVLDEAGVNLDLVESEGVQPLEIGKADAEIVERDPDARALELAHQRRRDPDVAHQRALGNFHLQPLQRKAARFRRRPDQAEQPGVLQLLGR